VPDTSSTNVTYKPGDEANGHVLSADGVWVPLLSTAPVETPAAPKKRTWLKVLGGATAAMVLLGVVAGLSGSPATDAAPATDSAPAADPAPQAPAPAAEPEGTVAQLNALRSAESYLDFSGFSRLGLIGQLSSEYGDGYTVEEATWAVDQLDVDWNEQAVRAGESYLEFSGFSRQGLIDQLSSEYGDQFTVEQATFAADTLGL
jgi:hypothetical protein